MDAFTTGAAAAWLREFQASVSAHRDELTALDAAIGDADHGTNLDRGMTAAVAALDAGAPATLDELFKRVGMALVQNVGGASGPLFGTLFLRLGAAIGPVADAGVGAVGVALAAGLAGVEARGKATTGEKTMLDALAPAVSAWQAAAVGGTLRDAAAAAERAAAEGRDATAPLRATKGRASYLGERSEGHVDPGAASTALLFQALAAVLSEPGA